MERNLPFLLCFALYLRTTSKYKPPGGGLYSEGRLNGGFLRYEFGGLIFGGAYFRNFTVFSNLMIAKVQIQVFLKKRVVNESIGQP